MTKQHKFYRQGDVGIQEINTLPKGLQENKDNIIVHSDSTLHDHSLKTGKVYVNKDGELFLDAPQDTQIVHTEDHKPIDLPKGKYKIIRQREYVMENMTKLVID